MKKLKAVAPERCRNCTNPVSGDFCSTCGQKVHFDSEPSLHEFTHELVHEFLHLDGKIFRSLRILLTRPGELTIELLRGRRASYIGPIRLYLAISLTLFLIMSAFSKEAPKLNASTSVLEARASMVDRALFNLTPATQREKVDQFNAAHPGRLQTFAAKAKTKIFFVLVPVAALLMQLTYWSRRKKYVPFLYFSLHYHAAIFGMGCFALILFIVNDILQLGLETAIGITWYVYSFFYLILALRRVWGGSIGGTLLRTGALIASYALCFFITILTFVLIFVNLNS